MLTLRWSGLDSNFQFRVEIGFGFKLAHSHRFACGGRVNKSGKPIEAPGNIYTLNPTGQPHSAMIATENIALVIYSGEIDDVKSVEIVDIEPPLEKVA